VLPDGIVPDPEYLDTPMSKYSLLSDTREYRIARHVVHVRRKNDSCNISCLIVVVEGYHKPELPLVDISEMIDEDWVLLADKLGINPMDVNTITFEYPGMVSKQCLTMLQLWNRQTGNKNSCKYSTLY